MKKWRKRANHWCSFYAANRNLNQRLSSEKFNFCLVTFLIMGAFPFLEWTFTFVESCLKIKTNTLGPIKKVTVLRVASKLPPPESATQPNVYLLIVTSMRKQYETIGADLITNKLPFWHGWCNCVIICHNSLLKLSEQTSSLPSSSVPMETGTDRSAIPWDLVYSSGYRGFISFDR